MANKTIHELTTGTPVAADEIPYWDTVNGVTKKALKSDLQGATGATGPTGPAGADGTDVNANTTPAFETDGNSDYQPITGTPVDSIFEVDGDGNLTIKNGAGLDTHQWTFDNIEGGFVPEVTLAATAPTKYETASATQSVTIVGTKTVLIIGTMFIRTGVGATLWLKRDSTTLRTTTGGGAWNGPYTMSYIETVTDGTYVYSVTQSGANVQADQENLTIIVF